MSLEGVIWAFRQHETSPTQRLVLLAMADSAADDLFWGGWKLVNDKTGLSKASIYRAQSDLKGLGLIEDHKDGKRDCLRLRLNPESESQSETPESHSETAESQSETRSIQGTQVEPKQNTAGSADRVWAHYLSMPGKQQRDLPSQERRVINESLKVATEDELIRAISMCFRSDYHMKTGRYKDRPGQKYDKLTQIIRGRQGKDTTRERIDFWLERETTAVAGSGVTSADPAVIARRKQDVQRGHRLKGDAIAVRKATEAEAWLREHGITVTRGDDGYPTFS